MSSEKLRKYLAYYQRILKAEPDNIEARLRLASIFRELGRTEHAVEEYVVASKLLAKEGLPLEAIAACKAVLELEPGHQGVQYFLARLFAHAPEAIGHSSRVAQPVGDVVPSSGISRQTPLYQEPVRIDEVDDAPIELSKPKGEATRTVDVVGQPEWEHEQPTFVYPSVSREDDEEVTAVGLDDDPPSLADVPVDARTTVEMEATRRDLDYDEPARSGRGKAFETFELGVFDMDSLGLDDEESDYDADFLDEFEGEVGDFLADEVSETIPAVMRIDREDLADIPLLSDLSAGTFVKLLEVLELETVPTGTAIVRPEDDRKTLYIIVRGHAQVSRVVDGERVLLEEFGPGDFFGEFRLLTGRSGLATVRARTDCELLALHEPVLTDIADKNPEIWDVLWDFYYARMLNNLLATSPMFKPLPGRDRRLLAESFEMQEIVAGEMLLREGDPCRYLFLILAGEASVERQIAGSTHVLATMREGEFFGIASSLNEEPYLADVRAVRDTTVWRLPAAEFQSVTNSHPEVNHGVELMIMSRRHLNDAFTSGVTGYAELGVAKFK